MKVVVHEVESDHDKAGFEKDGRGCCSKTYRWGVSQASGEKRDSLPARVNKMAEIVRNDPDSSYILWHDLEDERRAIQDALPEAVSIYGSQDLDLREQAIVDFSDGKFKYLSAKPVIAGSGCNFSAFATKPSLLASASSSTISFKYTESSDFCKAHPVEIHIIHSKPSAKCCAR